MSSLLSSLGRFVCCQMYLEIHIGNLVIFGEKIFNCLMYYSPRPGFEFDVRC